MERARALSCWNGKEVVVRPVGEVREELHLGEGRTNQNFIADCEGARCFVRVGSDLPFFGVNRAREQAASRAAHAVGVGPAVRHAEPDAMVVDFVDGKALTEEDLHRAGAEGPRSVLLTALGKTLRALHDAPVPPELEAFREEVSSVGWGGPHLEKWLRYAEDQKYSRLPLLANLRDFIKQLEHAAGPLGPNKFCHFDLLADNLVLKKDGGIMLVDFEYSAPGQPFMDLAVLAMGCSLTAEEERSLLSAYLDREASEEDLRRFKAVRVLAALRETFWGVTAELSRSSALSDAEALSYADANFAKFCELREDFLKS